MCIRDRFPALARHILIDDDQRNVPNVGRRRITEHRELNDRRDDDDAEEARILPQLQEFLADDVGESCQAHCLLTRTEASARTTTAYTTRAMTSGRKSAGPTPLSTIPRRATRK